MKYDICIDFDGTCVTHDFPRVGKEIGAAPVLKDLINAGHRLILFTMRSGEHLTNALAWFEKHGIPLYGVQKNPTQDKWTSSPKAYGQIYIDDSGFGAPLKIDLKKSQRPFIDWKKVRLAFNQGPMQVLPESNNSDVALEIILEHTGSTEWEDVEDMSWTTSEVQKLIEKSLNR